MASFSDDFNRPDSTDLGAGWVEVSGDWSIVSGQLSPGSAGGTIILRVAGAMASNDHYAQVTIAATTAASHGVWCRGNSNITSGYLWRNDGTSWNLFSVVGGSFTSIGSYAAAAAPGDVAKLQVVGSTIKGFVNGIERVSVVDTSVATGTSVGIRGESTNAIRYDDFSAGDVTAGATLGIAASGESAQPLTGSKTSTLSPASATETAQPVTGAKTAALGVAAASEAAQQLAGGKTTLLGAAATSEAAQQLIGSKSHTLGVAVETSTALPFAGPHVRPADALTATVEGPVLTASVEGPVLTATANRPVLTATSSGGG
jgi:hypothetical protein